MSLKGLIPQYPDSSEIALSMRGRLHPLLRAGNTGVSEFTFANLYLFRETHSYRLSVIEDGLLLVSGKDVQGAPYFMLPTGTVPRDASILKTLFKDFGFLKNATAEMAKELGGAGGAGFRAEEDRDNFDYLYSSAEIRGLKGRRFHGKKNLINAFLAAYDCAGKPLLVENVKDALHVLDEWRRESGIEGDYRAAREALLLMEELSLCGGIYYIGGAPAAYVLGEELSGDVFAVHFEKGVSGYKGLLQFVNQNFVSILPGRYAFINREQDLGDEGLRRAKMSWRPSGFVKKYRVYPG